MLEAAIKGASSRPEVLSLAGQTALKFAAKAAVVDPGRAEVCEGLRLAADIFTTIFYLAAGSGEIEFRIGSAKARLPATGATSSVTAVNWRLAFHTSCICRQREHLDHLSRFPVDIFSKSTTKADAVYDVYIDALSSLWRRADDTGHKLLAALKATEPANLTVMPEEYALNVITPEIEMAYRLADGNQGAFNESVRFAIQRHKVYWSKGDRRRDAVGYLALGALAFASLAHDTGIPIEVESEYLPVPLYEGDCR